MTRYGYTDHDGIGTVDPAIRAYGCEWVGMTCERVPGAPWKHGKTVVRFSDNGPQVVVRTRLLRKL